MDGGNDDEYEFRAVVRHTSCIKARHNFFLFHSSAALYMRASGLW